MRPANPRRRKRCEKSLLAFLQTYCIVPPGGGFGLIDHRPSAKLREYVADLEAAVVGTGLVHCSFPRGGGKTSLAKGALAWGCLYGKLHLGVIFAASAALAKAILRDVWRLFSESPKLREDFPEVSLPIDAADGIAQRYATITVGDLEEGSAHPARRVNMARNSSQIVLPTVEGFAGSGATLMAFGAGAAARGLSSGSIRPEFVLLDDLQKRRDARSAKRVDELEEWISADVQGLAGARRRLSMLMTSTPIAAGDLSERFSDPELHPEWSQRRYCLVDRWPDREDLWARYDELARADMRARDANYRTATAFYRAHRDEMDAGAAVLDPLSFDPASEISAIQRARNLLLRMGRVAYDAEYQLSTRSPSSVVSISSRIVRKALNGSEHYAAPSGLETLLAFVDVNADPGLSYAITGWGKKATSAVLDYGRVSGEGGRLIPENATERATQSILSAAIGRLVRAIRDARFVAEDGRELRVAAIWVDSGWQTETVEAACRLMRRRGFANCWPCKGYSHAYRGRSRKTIVSETDHVDFRRAGGAEWMTQDSDVAKERAQRAFLGAPLSPGSCSLWGDDEFAHHDFSEEVASEKLVDIARGRTVEVYRWTMTPGVGNHWLDALGGTFSMAEWYHLLDAREPAMESVKAAEDAGEAPVAPTPRRTRKRRRRIVPLGR